MCTKTFRKCCNDIYRKVNSGYLFWKKKTFIKVNLTQARLNKRCVFLLSDNTKALDMFDK